MRTDHVDNHGGPPEYGPMQERVAKLEADVAIIKIDVAVIKTSGATKSDVAECKAAIAEAKASIILWVTTAVFMAQLIPQLIRLIEKYS